MDVSSDNRSWLEICDEELVEEQQKILEELIIPDVSVQKEIFEDSKSVEQFPMKTKIKNTSNTDTEVLYKTKSLSEVCNSEFKKNAKIPGVLSYAKVVSQGIKKELPADVNMKTECNITTEDLSLTSHLDVFHVQSPHKDVMRNDEAKFEMFLDEDTVVFSPNKFSSENAVSKNTKRPFMLIDSPVQVSRGRTSSIHSTHKIAKSEINSDVHSSTNKNVDSPNKKRELEVNPEVLSRRQKQIDYGKNTLGYERYLKIIPKHKRTKEHPKTPPKHLKMSRRAWDGLIKNWRMKLHKWDPASENDNFDLESVNFDEFSFSSEDQSSYDSSSIRSDSTVSTPKQGSSITESDEGINLWNKKVPDKSENSKELWSKCPNKTDKSDDDEFLGCEPLSENCVKACS